MKKNFIRLMLFFIILAGVSLSASAQIYVRIRPVAPVIVQTERPSSAHVWIGEEWNEEGGNYVYRGGHWATPPHPGYRWYQGHWNHHRRHGDQWIHGSWRS
jgi:hypothetical protein